MTRLHAHPMAIGLVLVLGVAGATCPAQPPSGGGGEDGEEKPAEPTKILMENVGFATPESVLYDSADDVYLVSNINGAPADVDGNGFISRVSPDGKVQTLKWIDGAADGVTLNAPKGTAILGGTLYVADISVVRMFDLQSGAPKGEVKIPGATFVNDVVASSDGVYVSDTGVDASFKPSGADAIYKIDAAGKLTTVAKSEELGHPNGLLTDGDHVWVVTFGSGELYDIASGKKAGATKLPKGQLDGVVRLSDGSLLVSSWEAQAVYRGKPGGTFTAVVEGVEAPADIGWDSKRGRVLVPKFNGNAVLIQAIE